MKNGQAFNPRPLFRTLSIPEGMAKSCEISPGAKLLYGALVRRAGDNGYCWPSVRVLADDIGLSARQIQRYLRELEEHQLIERRVRYNQGHQRANEYHFLWSASLFGGANPNISGVTDPSPLGTTDPSPLGMTDVSPRRGKAEGSKVKGERASAPPADSSARTDPDGDDGGAVVAAAEIVATAQGLKLPPGSRERRNWLRGAEPLAQQPPEMIRAAAELKLKTEPNRWRTKPLLPRFLAEDWPALMRELEGQPDPATKPLDAFEELQRSLEAA